MASFVGRKPQPLTGEQLSRFDRIADIADKAIANRSLVSWKAVAESTHISYSSWLSLRDRVCRLDMERRQRLAEINAQIMQLALGARGRPVKYESRPAPTRDSIRVKNMPAPSTVSSDLTPVTVAAARHAIDAYDKLVADGGVVEVAQNSAVVEGQVAPSKAITIFESVVRLCHHLDPAERRRVLRGVASFYELDGAAG